MRNHLLALPVLGLSLLAAIPASAQQSQMSGPAFESRLSEMEAQMRQLNGKLEQSEFQNRQLRQQLERMQTDTNTRLQSVEQARFQQQQMQQQQMQQQQAQQPAVEAYEPDVLEEVNEAPGPESRVNMNSRRPAVPSELEHDEALIRNSPQQSTGQLGNLRVQNNQVVGADLQPKATPLPQKPDDYGLNPQEQYDRAFSLLRQAKYDEAEAAFKKFIKKNPEDKLAVNAKYWLGETYYVSKKFSEAAVTFAEAYEGAPQGAKAPDSLLKLAMSLRELNSRDDACTTLASLRKKYPGASASVKARAEEEWKTLTCFNKATATKSASSKTTTAKPKAE